MSLSPRKQPLDGRNKSLVTQPRGRSLDCPGLDSGPREETPRAPGGRQAAWHPFPTSVELRTSLEQPVRQGTTRTLRWGVPGRLEGDELSSPSPRSK